MRKGNQFDGWIQIINKPNLNGWFFKRREIRKAIKKFKTDGKILVITDNYMNNPIDEIPIENIIGVINDIKIRFGKVFVKGKFFDQNPNYKKYKNLTDDQFNRNHTLRFAGVGELKYNTGDNPNQVKDYYYTSVAIIPRETDALSKFT